MDGNSDDTFGGFVSDVGNTIDPFIDYKFSDLFYETRFIDLVRDLVDDDDISVFGLFDMSFPSDDNRSLSSTVNF